MLLSPRVTTPHLVDLAVILAYLAGITWFGARFRRSQHSLRDYFLGGRTAPWWAIAFSIVSAETSTLTVIGTPSLAFNGNFGFLQVVFGYLVARVLIALLFLPHYFRGEMFTAYELMQRRFGERMRRFTAGVFLMLRALAEGVRAFALSIVIGVVLAPVYREVGVAAWAEVGSILLIVALTLFYTFEGGMSAVIWTDVVQMVLYIGGAVLSFFVILGEIHGGWGHVLAAAGAAGKFQIFDFRVSAGAAFFARNYSFWAGLIGGCFLTTASHGTEQLMVQRYLAAPSEADARKALLGSWLVIFFQFALFLVIGAMLWVHYGDLHLAAPKLADTLYPAFVWNNLPPGVAGLVIAAILAAGMSNLSAALNALASTTIMDFHRPLAGHGAVSDTDQLRLARWATVAWGAVLVAIGLVARHWGSVLEAGLSIASVLYGSLLGVFFLGLLTRRVGEMAAIVAMAAGLVFMLYVKLGTHIAFTWWVPIGTLATFAVGLIASYWPRMDANAHR